MYLTKLKNIFLPLLWIIHNFGAVSPVFAPFSLPFRPVTEHIQVVRGCAEGETAFRDPRTDFSRRRALSRREARPPGRSSAAAARSRARVRAASTRIYGGVPVLISRARRARRTCAARATWHSAFCLCRGEHGVQAGLRPGGLAIQARPAPPEGVRQGVKRRAVKHPQSGEYGKLHALLPRKLAPAVSFARVHRRRARGNEASGLHPPAR